MKIYEMRYKYPGKICICRPHTRDAGSRRVNSWICLQVVETVSAAAKALERFERDGVKDAVAIPTTDMFLRGNLAVRYCRVYYGLQR